MEALTGSKPIATILTWLVFLLFCALIATGWWYLLEPTLGKRYLDIPGAMVLTVIAALCARQIGQYRAAAIRAGEKPSIFRGWKPWILLAFISALGTLNAAFVLFESGPILRQDVALVRNYYGTLRDRAHEKLPPAGYAEKVAQVDGLLKALSVEIDSPFGGGYCGVGPRAREVIDKIKLLIPDYHLLAGSGPIKPCDRAKTRAAAEAYAGMAHEMLIGDRDFMGVKGPEKVKFLAELDQRYAGAMTGLTELERSAAGLGSVGTLDKSKLTQAKNSYNADRATFFTLGGQSYDDLPQIKSLQSDEISSYAATLDLAFKRFFNPSTWFYLLLALGLDYATIYLLTQLNVKFGRDRKRKDDEDDPAIVRFLTDPRFLWVNPPLRVIDR